MSSTMAPSTGTSGLRVLDPDLPFLASEVAIDVDNMLLGISDDRTAMRGLANKLLQSTDTASAGSPPRSRMDMATLTVLGEAISVVVDIQCLKKVEDLLAKASQIAKVLVSENPLDNPDELERARDFCVALSRAAASYSESIRDLRPSHPFRR